MAGFDQNQLRPLKNIHVQIFYSAVELPGNPPGETLRPQVRGTVTLSHPLLQRLTLRGSHVVSFLRRTLAPV